MINIGKYIEIVINWMTEHWAHFLMSSIILSVVSSRPFSMDCYGYLLHYDSGFNGTGLV